MTNKHIKAFGSSDVIVTFETNMDTFTVPARRFVCESHSDGSVYGIFELATELYDDQINVFDNMLSTLSDGMNIVVSQRGDKSSKEAIEPLIFCEECDIVKKNINIVAGDVVTTQYYFSNQSDWETHIISLPETKKTFNPDPLYRIARAIEDLNRQLATREYDEMDVDNRVFTVEELTSIISRLSKCDEEDVNLNE